MKPWLLAVAVLLLTHCNQSPSTEALPARLLQPGKPPPNPVQIPNVPAPTVPKQGNLPEPEGGDRKARAVVLGRARPESVGKQDDGGWQLGKVHLSTDRRVLELPGVVNQRKGIVEYFAVGPQGKTHESVFVLNVEGTRFMVGCMLMGLEPAPLNAQEDPGLVMIRSGNEADPAHPDRRSGSQVILEVGWEVEGGKKRWVRAEELTWNRETGQTMPKTTWVFTGSRIWRGNFVAEQEQSYIAIWPDRSALFNNPSPAKNPYRGDAFGYEANPKTLPPVGTPITLRATRVDS